MSCTWGWFLHIEGEFSLFSASTFLGSVKTCLYRRSYKGWLVFFIQRSAVQFYFSDVINESSLRFGVNIAQR
jgi:hypothetical protein